MSEARLKLNLFRLRKGEQLEAVETYYVFGRTPAGGTVARVVIEKDLDLRKNDTLIFAFTTEKAREE